MLHPISVYDLLILLLMSMNNSANNLADRIYLLSMTLEHQILLALIQSTFL